MTDDHAPVRMSHFRIEKTRVPVSVTLVGGAAIAGEIFVQRYTPLRSGPERPQDLLNSAEPFFPLAETSGETVMIAKDLVREVAVPGGEAESASLVPGLEPAIAEVMLVDGTQHTGSLFLDVPIEQPRLLDFLNYFQHRFLTMHTTDGLVLVNRRLVARVRPLD